MELLETPNPNAKKINIQHDKIVGEYINKQDLDQDSFELRILNLPEIDSIFVGPNLYTILKKANADWESISRDINTILDKI